MSAAHELQPPSRVVPRPRAAPQGSPVARTLLKGFFTFYYRYAALLNRAMPHITLEGKRLWVPPRVYKPLENEHRFRDFVRPGERVCDLGCGAGTVAVFCGEVAGSVLALDLSPDALEATRRNCEAHGLANVEVRASDMFAAAEGDFDVICANPPFVEIPMSGAGQQWATSVTFLDRLFAEGSRRLREGGRIVALYPKRKESRLEALARPHGLHLVETRPIGPKSVKHWLVCALYMELFFGAQFHVFERR